MDGRRYESCVFLLFFLGAVAVSHVSSTTPDPEFGVKSQCSFLLIQIFNGQRSRCRRVAQALSDSTGDARNRACVGLIVQKLVSELTDLLIVDGRRRRHSANSETS